MEQMTASEARAMLPTILDRVAAGEEVTITRHGQVVAVIIRPDALRARRADRSLAAAERLRDLVDQARHRPLGEATISTKRAKLLAAEVDAGRGRD